MTTSPVRVAVIDHQRLLGGDETDGAGSAEVSWARFGDRTLVWSATATADSALRALSGSSVTQTLAGTPYLVLQVGAAFNAAHPEVPVLLDKGRYQVIDCTPAQVEDLVDPHGTCWTIRPLEPASIVVERMAPNRARDSGRVTTAELVSGLSRAGYESMVTDLASRPTRHSLSSGFDQAADWALQLFLGWGYEAEIVPVSLPAGSSANVVARRAGTGQQSDRGEVLVTAHLDSVNAAGGVSAPAPGADDNASGAAGVLEIGRALAEVGAEHDLTLILFGGEEQGLHGSYRYVSGLTPQQRGRILGVINMDMIAGRNMAQPTVLLEGDPLSQSLIDRLAQAAADHTSLVIETSLVPFASDHVPFIEAGIPAVLTIEGNDGANTTIHTASDVLSGLDFDLALEILRMNLATTAELLQVLDPATPIAATPRVSGPVVAWGPDRLDLFVIGSDSKLHHKWWGG